MLRAATPERLSVRPSHVKTIPSVSRFRPNRIRTRYNPGNVTSRTSDPSARADRAGQPRLLRRSTRRRSPTPSTTGSSASSRRSRRPIPSCAPPTVPPSASARRVASALAKVTHRRPDALARQRLHAPRSWPPGRSATPGIVPEVRTGRLHRRDQDRRRRGEPHLRGRPADRGRHPRQRRSSARTSPPTSAPSPTCRSRSRARVAPADGGPGRGLPALRRASAESTRSASRRASRSSPTRATPPPAGSASSIPTHHPAPPAPDVRLRGRARSRAGSSARTHSELLDLLASLGLPGRAAPRALRHARPRCRSAIEQLRGAAPPAPLPGRRRGRQGGPARPPRRARRRRRARAALGHRPEVRARSGRDPSCDDIRDQRGPHRRAQSLGGARAGARSRGVTVTARDAAQRGPDRAEGHPDRRPGRGDPRRRGDPPGGAARHRGLDAERRASAVPDAGPLPRLRHAGRAPRPRRGDALLPQRLLPRPGARGHRALRLARRDGHPRTGLRAGAPAARRRS